jgi:hypothetical protein
MSNFRFTILLSASVPSVGRSEKYQANFTKIKNAQIQIDEAVIGLARNTFSSNGKLIFGGHPTISPLVAMVATEYSLAQEVENVNRNDKDGKRISIFQSKAYAAVSPKETTSLFDLGYSNIIWTDATNGEEFNPEIQKTAQCHKSLEFMRREMMKEKIDALVCIGGMEGVELEFTLFREIHPTKPIFILKSTGGASKILADEYSNSNVVKILDDIDYSKIKTEKEEDKYSEKFDIIPYSFITALIVKEILDNKNN